MNMMTSPNESYGVMPSDRVTEFEAACLADVKQRDIVRLTELVRIYSTVTDGNRFRLESWRVIAAKRWLDYIAVKKSMRVETDYDTLNAAKESHLVATTNLREAIEAEKESSDLLNEAQRALNDLQQGEN